MPKLRFPEFEGEWEQRTLSDLGDFIGGGTPSSSNSNFWNGDIPWVSSSDLEEDNIHSINVSRFITEEAINKSSAKFCKAPLILIVSRVGVGKVAYSDSSLCTSQDFTNIVNFTCDGLFLSYLLSVEMKNSASSMQGTSIKGISSTEIKSKKLFIPNNKEQQKIASFLSLLDTCIQTQIKIIDKLKTSIQILRKKLFKQDLRFKDNIGNSYSNWETKKLRQLGTFFSGGTPLTTQRHYFDGNIPFIRSGEINAFVTEQYISEEGLRNSSAKMVEIGDLIYALYGATSGEVGISKIRGAINQAILCLRTDLNNVYLLNYLKFQKENILSTFLQGGQGNLSSEIIKSLKIPVPTIKEQAHIASILSNMDSKIEIEINILNIYQEQKKYLLSNLFI